MTTRRRFLVAANGALAVTASPRRPLWTKTLRPVHLGFRAVVVVSVSVSLVLLFILWSLSRHFESEE